MGIVGLAERINAFVKKYMRDGAYYIAYILLLLPNTSSITL